MSSSRKIQIEDTIQKWQEIVCDWIIGMDWLGYKVYVVEPCRFADLKDKEPT